MNFPKFSTKTLAILVVTGVSLIALLPSLYFYNKYQEVKRSTQSPKTSDEDIKALIDRIASHIELPKGEEPTIATVSDKEKIKNQPFFIKAQNGDKVLIFTDAKKAILYRPSADKIIEVSSINLGTASGTVVENTSVKVAIYNGTKAPGLAAATEKDLKQRLPFVEVVLKDNSTEDFTKTVVVDLKGNKKDFANQIAKVVGGEVTSLPAGEKRPDADILIIVGQ